MPLDAVCLHAVCEELRSKLIGVKVDRVQQPMRDQLILQTRMGKVLLCAGGSQPRVHMTKLERENPSQPPMFCMILRKYCVGLKIQEIEQPPMERLLRFHLEGYNEFGQLVRFILTAECMGRNANLILSDGEDRIVECLRRVEGDGSNHRMILPGLKYELPPKQEKWNPVTEIFPVPANEEPLEKWVLSSYLGFSPLLAREIAFRVSGKSDILCSELSNEQKAEVPGVMTQILHEQRPVIIKKNGKTLDYSCVLITQWGSDAEVEETPSFSEMLDQYYADKEQTERIRQWGADLQKLAKNAHERMVRKLAMQEEELKKAKNRETYRIRGELIKANLYQLKKGDSSFEAVNYYEENCPKIRIELDPTMSPQENAAKQFKLYSKAKNAESFLTDLIEKTIEERDYLESVLAEIGFAEKEQDFLDIRTELQNNGYIRQGKAKNQLKRKTGPRELLSSSGMRILVGRNNEENDRLTHKLADFRDLWFHVQKEHGSHVILCLEGKEADEASMEEAAGLAAYYSQAKDSDKVPVDFCQVKYVKKPSSAHPGQVFYTNYKTIVVKPCTIAENRHK